MEFTTPETYQEQLSMADRESFRRAISRFASGVAIVTTRDEGDNYGLTASAVTSLSLKPPMLLICLNRASATQQAITRSRIFAVNILREHQSELARLFASTRPDKFAGLSVTYGASGVPLLPDMLATIECRVSEVVAGGTHAVFLAAVQRVQMAEAMPLVYFRGRMGRFSFAYDQDGSSLWREMRWEDNV